MSKKKQLVFLDVSIDGDPVERMVFEVSSYPIAEFVIPKYKHLNSQNEILTVNSHEFSCLQLFTDIAPKTAENFRALCTGDNYKSAACVSY